MNLFLILFIMINEKYFNINYKNINYENSKYF